MNESKTYTSKVLEICENGDAIIELTPELCGEMGWKVGDTLDIDYKDGEVILKKVEKS